MIKPETVTLTREQFSLIVESGDGWGGRPSTDTLWRLAQKESADPGVLVREHNARVAAIVYDGGDRTGWIDEGKPY